MSPDESAQQGTDQEQPKAADGKAADKQPDKAPPKISTLDDIKQKADEAKHGKALLLPTGLKFIVKRPSIRNMAKQGIIPDSLAKFVVNMKEDSSGLKGEELEKFYKFQDIIVQHAIVEPKVDEEAVKTLDELDKAAIFQHVMEVERPEVLKKFRRNEQGKAS